MGQNVPVAGIGGTKWHSFVRLGRKGDKMEQWQRRMGHERDWRDAGVELGYRSAPKVADDAGSLGVAGPLFRVGATLYRRFFDKGHDNLCFEDCKCSKGN